MQLRKETYIKIYFSKLISVKLWKFYVFLLNFAVFSTFSLLTIYNHAKINDTIEKRPRIFCMILTHQKNFKIKTRIVNNTWAKECDKYFFITNMQNTSIDVTHEYSDPFPILQPAYHGAENYNKLTDKVYRTIQAVYQKYNDYDWYFKGDDDTIVFFDNLRSFLDTKNSSQPVSFGYDINKIAERGYHSGGAGYILSNEALKRLGKMLFQNYTFCRNSGVEDVDLGVCIRKLKIYPEKSIDELGRERFHPFNVSAHINGYYPEWVFEYAANPPKKGVECCSESSISFHYLKPHQIEKLYSLWEHYKLHKNEMNFASILYKSIE